MEHKIVHATELSPKHLEEFVTHLRSLEARYGANAVLVAQIFHKAEVGARKLFGEPNAPAEERELAHRALRAAIAEFAALLAAALATPDEKICACIEALIEFEHLVSEDVLGMHGIADADRIARGNALALGALDRMRRAGL